MNAVLARDECARPASGSFLCDAQTRWSECLQIFHRLDQTQRAVIWGSVCLAGLHPFRLWRAWSYKSPGWNNQSFSLAFTMWLELACFPAPFLPLSLPSLPPSLGPSISHQMTYIKDNSRSNNQGLEIVHYFVFFCFRQLNE